MHKTVVIPAISYGSDCWTVQKKAVQRLHSTLCNG